MFAYILKLPVASRLGSLYQPAINRQYAGLQNELLKLDVFGGLRCFTSCKI
jgi:hypothetical protein